MLKFYFVVIVTIMCSFNVNAKEEPISPEAALQRLVEGNRRFAKDQMVHPDRGSDRRAAISAAQRPFAVVVGCSDSRVSPEIVFDQGLGDLFVIRVAGNVVGPLELDSIEYSILVNGSVIVIVLGHQNCGAIQAVLQKQTKDIEAIATLIGPAVAKVNVDEPNAIENAVKANVRSVIDQLRKSTVIAEYTKSGKCGVVGGYYNLSTGLIEIIDNPYQG